jgi:hypothetical protein
MSATGFILVQLQLDKSLFVQLTFLVQLQLDLVGFVHLQLDFVGFVNQSGQKHSKRVEKNNDESGRKWELNHPS